MPRVKSAPASPSVKLLRDSFDALKPRADLLARTFYRILFERHPDAVSYTHLTLPTSDLV